MFSRRITEDLKIWASKPERKPLVLRGARQVGKTSVVKLFASGFTQFIYLNLDKSEDLKIFRQETKFQDVVDALFFLKGAEKTSGKTLLFIDEIQNSPEAVGFLRYFYEELPELYVIAAGSLLESLIDKNISFPVGRVEYMAIRPCSFEEFLSASGETKPLELLRGSKIPGYAHDKLTDLFRKYALIGGMPEIIGNYIEFRDLTRLKPLYESLMVSYLDDVEKYAKNPAMTHIIRFIISNAFQAASQRITYEGFGNSLFRSREISEAFRVLEKAMLLQQVYPTTNTSIPVSVKYRSPKLQMLDTGLVNFNAGIHSEILGSEWIEDAYRGRIAEHVAGQELLASNNSVMARLNYWIRDSRNSQAEVDYVIQFKDLLIPVEVKSGAGGKLKSLHMYMDEAPHFLAIRISSGKMSVEKVQTPRGKSFLLVNLPFYMAGRISNVIENINTKEFLGK